MPLFPIFRMSLISNVPLGAARRALRSRQPPLLGLLPRRLVVPRVPSGAPLLPPAAFFFFFFFVVVFNETTEWLALFALQK